MTDMDISNINNYEYVKGKILTVLEIYPKISPSMLQIGIGSSLPANLWRPVLESLIAEGLVEQDTIVATNSKNRLQNFTVLSKSKSIAGNSDESNGSSESVEHRS